MSIIRMVIFTYNFIIMKTKIYFFILLLLSSSISYASTWSWAKSAQGTGYEYANAVATDKLGNVVIAGAFNGDSLVFDTVALKPVGGKDIFIAKFDNQGSLIWAKPFGGTQDDIAKSMVIDSFGNIIVTGFYESPTILFDTITLINNGSPGYADVFIAKFDENGNVIWSKKAGGSNNDRAESISQSPSGSLTITGYTYSSPMVFDTVSCVTNGGISIFVAEYTKDGDAIWAKSAKGSNYDYAKSIDADHNNNLIITGNFNSLNLVFNADTIFNQTNTGHPDAFIAKYDSVGNIQWAQSLGGSLDDYGSSTICDANGDIYLAGYYGSQSVVIGADTFINKGDHDVFLAKYSPAGTLLWAKHGGGAGYDQANALAIDSSGYIYMSGYFDSEISFDTLSVTGSNGRNLFIAKYDSLGNVIETDASAWSQNDNAGAFALDNENNIYFAGDFTSTTLSFGSINLTNSGNNDMFVAKRGNDLATGSITGKTISAIMIYPNPSTDGLFNILFSNEKNKVKHIEIINSMGQIIGTYDVGNQSLIKGSISTNGVYFIRVVYDSGIEIGKIIVQ